MSDIPEKFVSKPVEIFALQRLPNDPNRDSEIIQWLIEEGGEYRYECRELVNNQCVPEAGHDLYIKTLEGEMMAPEGWWIIKGTINEFYPCKNEVFVTKYYPVKDVKLKKIADVKVENAD